MKFMIRAFCVVLTVCLLVSCAFRWPSNCPRPAEDQITKRGHLLMTPGVTLQCQVEQYTNRMSCTKITDSNGYDKWFCEGGDGKVIFLFDENGVLKTDPKIERPGNSRK